MAGVQVPIQTKYDGKGFEQLRKDAEKAQRDLLRSTRQQISEQRRLASLTGKLDRALASEAKAQEQANARRLQDAKEFGTALLAAGTIVAKFTADSVMMAAQAETVERSFTGLSGGAGAAAANMEAMGRATRDLISETEQQAIANQLLGMRIVDSADELETLVGGARRLGKEFKGLGAADAANEFALMLSNMSYLRLDQFGLSAGKVRERVNELKESGMSAEEAFKTAVFEEMEKTLSRLGPEIETTADRVARMAASWTDVRTEFGAAADAMAGATGLSDTLFGGGGFLDALKGGAEAWQGIAENVELTKRALDIMNSSGDTAVETIRNQTIAWLEQIPVIGANVRMLDFWQSQVLRRDELEAAMTQAGQELEERRRQEEAAAQAAAQATQAIQAETQAVEENNDAQEEAAERLERVNDIRKDAARQIIDIDRQAAEDSADVWDDYWSDQESEWQDHNARLIDLKRKAAGEQRKAESDLSKELAKLNKDTEKQIADVQKKAAAEKNNEQRRRQVDALGDERLFNFELQQMAAEGQGNAIREAIERRAIEEQIAKEKAAVESQIEQQKQQEEIGRIRDTAAERRQSLQENFAAETELRDQRLAEDLAAEQDNYAERMIDLRTYREEKLAEIEASKQEAVAKLAEELATMGELTQTELNDLVKVAGKKGEEYGAAFAAGVKKGYEETRDIEDLLGLPADFTRPSRAGSGSPSPLGGPLQSFQFGGTVAGPIGAPTLAIVHGGETVSPVGKSPTNINVTINAAGGLNQARIEALFQQFTDEVLIPALS